MKAGWPSNALAIFQSVFGDHSFPVGNWNSCPEAGSSSFDIDIDADGTISPPDVSWTSAAVELGSMDNWPDEVV